MAATPQVPAGGPKIPDVVPLADASDERQQLYGPLTEHREQEIKEHPPEEPRPKVYPPAPEPGVMEPPNVDDDDKIAFVDAVLGDRQYEKSYVLYGNIEAKLQDRTAERTEAVYAKMEEHKEKGELTFEFDSQWVIWVERFQLAANLIEVRQKGLDTKAYPPTDNFLGRARELMKLPKALYQALLQANRDFEQLTSALTQEAQNTDFWPAGRSTSPSRRTSPAPSTSPQRLATSPRGA